VVTMYNEEEELFARTMMGVIDNIKYMNQRSRSKTWGKEAWKKIVVCVVSDGRAKINPRTRAVLAAMGCYQEGIAKQQVNGKDVTAHIYEVGRACVFDGYTADTSAVHHTDGACHQQGCRECEERRDTSTNALLFEGEESEEDQLT